MAEKAKSSELVDANPSQVPMAEVVSSTITQFVAECRKDQNDEPNLPPKPRFGSFLRVESQLNGLDILAVVYNVSTGPLDNVHRPSALGLTRQELQLEQPHIFSLLKTEVHAAIVGYAISGTGARRAFQHLPPQPPDVHDFVYPACAEEVLSITRDFELLRLLTNISDVPADELISATIREAHLITESDDDYLIEAGKKLSQILRSDYDRLLSILKKIKPDLFGL
ncbi:MAG: hypothetical protein K8F91_25755 [Candidatus Obscuribacterales bacterium]|nr:hypothetical protein [Candidatus Obscuribacterales bacterium]